jgi:hypothetical protein
MTRASILGTVVMLAPLVGAGILRSVQVPAIRPVDEATLRAYAGVYQWEPSGFLYLQLWSELSGSNQLVAVDERGDVRTLYPTEPDRFFAGPGAAVSDAIASRI